MSPKNSAKISFFLTPRREDELSRGSVLIEFAICMPVLIILLFYIHDLVKMKRYYSQTEFVAQQFANIIQNISQKRSDKKIKLLDLKHALATAWLTMYPGKTMYATSGSRHEFIHFPYVMVYYVKGVSGGKASCIWEYSIYSYTNATPTWNDNGKGTSDLSYSHIRWGTNVTPSTIYPSLKISEGEEKIIITPIME